MALETLKDLKQIGPFAVLQERPKKEDGSVDWALFDEQRKTSPIYVDSEVNMISFRIQKGPVKEFGVNGCQVDTLIEAASLIIEGMNKQFPCPENDMEIFHLTAALMWSARRKADREARGVEGQSKA